MAEREGKILSMTGCVVVLLLTACTQQQDAPANSGGPAFELLDGDRTGMQFSNELTPTKEFNVFQYMYFYNGGGVAVADFNQDGLMDIYFTANMESNALYLNEGKLHFKDVTEEAGVGGVRGWTTGVCAVDINQDGLMDLYVSQVGEYRNIEGHNQLYVCTGIDDQGIPHFKEEAEQYGLDLIGFGTQACFFDYDLDGDLDMFQLNHSVHDNGTFGQRKEFVGTYHPLSGDRMFRNDGGKFTEVTAACKIQSSVIGYGLGVACSDINLDGWPDLYVCNDFHENDYLYINQHDGTFKEVLTDQIQHTSRFSMGVDIADINDDGYNDIFSLDMHPYDPHILKASLGEDGYGTFEFKIGYGYNYQYARNNLQLNNHNNTFSEIGVMAGVYATDWSWAALFMDFDLDGYQDLFISNGIPRRMNDIDYINFVANDEVQWRIRTDNMEDADLALESKLPPIRLPNKFYRNTGDLSFTEMQNIGNDKPSFSNGAAYADFDNDGDMDIVVNNIAGTPYLYRNLIMESGAPKGAYLELRLHGSPQNKQAVGARVIAYRGKGRLTDENFPVKGYQSSVENGIHLGLGDLSRIDSIHLIWPDGTYQRLGKELCNRISEVSWQPGLPAYNFSEAAVPDTARVEVRDITSETGIDYTHKENSFVEFDREALIPFMTSTEGPALAVGDVNSDGLEDVFIGAAKWEQNVLFLQQPDGSFSRSVQPDLQRDSVFEDVDAEFTDVDGDGDQDLIVASGGNEFRNQAAPLLQRLYRNDGKGKLIRDTTAFQGIYMTAACVAVQDFDQDGDMDVFLGGRAVPWHYGVIPESYLLENDGTGHFKDVTEEVSAGLAKCGLVRDAKWADVNGDGAPDLIVAVEWGPLHVFVNNKGRFQDVELKGTNGLWDFIDVADFDGDGDLDFFAGNLGLNTQLAASPEKPVRLYLNDFDDNGQTEQLLTYYIGDREILYPTYAEVTKQLPGIKKKYPLVADFADASLEDLVGKDKLDAATVFKIYVTENSWFENKGNVEFVRHALPRKMQFAPLRAGLIEDFDGDGSPDLMVMGNYYESNIEMGRYDADYGNILFNNSDGFGRGFLQHLNITGQVRKIRAVQTGSGEIIVLARNNDSAIVLRAGGASPDL